MSSSTSDSETPIREVEKENVRLSRKLRRMEDNVRQMEEIQDSNSKLLSHLMLELEQEKARSHRLLLNILPQQIIDRMQSGETVIADRFESVTVLFSDFVAFTSISSELEAPVLVENLNNLFSEFDDLCEQMGVEKIKTIGDAYLAVGGLPGTRADHAAAVAETALGMADVIKGIDGSGSWQIRIGIHTGPAVAGVIGTRKFVYDVWGDTVNVASRLQDTSEPNRIQVSEPVANALQASFELEPRGSIDLKGKGATKTYFLLGSRG
jgi:adenylate cyclase